MATGAGTNFFQKITRDCSVSLTDDFGYAVLAKCVGTPPVIAGRFQHGCIMMQTDTSTGTTALFENVGSVLSPEWGTLDSSGLTPVTGQYKTFLTVGTANADYVTDGTNDSSQIQAAIAAAGIVGGQVYIKPGTYSITASIVPASNVQVVGAGTGTILNNATVSNPIFRHVDNAAGLTNWALKNLKMVNPEGSTANSWYSRGSVTNCVFEDLTNINTTTTTGPNNFIMFFDAYSTNEYIQINRCHFEGFTNGWDMLGSGMSNSTVENCTFKNGNGQGTANTGASYCVYKNNYFYKVGNPISLEGNSYGNLIDGNSSYWSGYFKSGLPTTVGEVSNNTIITNNRSYFSHGIQAQGTGMTIKGNSVYRSDTDGIIASVTESAIEGNMLYQNNYSNGFNTFGTQTSNKGGIQLINSAAIAGFAKNTITDNTIFGNNVSWTGADGISHADFTGGIAIDTSYVNTFVVNNRVTLTFDAGTGEVVDAGTSTTRVMSENYFSSSYYVDVRDFGAIPDARKVDDIITTSGSATATSVSGAFTSRDVGKSIKIYNVNSNAYIFRGTISSVINATTIVLSGNATATTASGNSIAYWGTNYATQIQSALTYAASLVSSNDGGQNFPLGSGYARVVFPCDKRGEAYIFNSTLTVGANVIIDADAMLYSNVGNGASDRTWAMTGQGFHISHLTMETGGGMGIDMGGSTFNSNTFIDNLMLWNIGQNFNGALGITSQIGLRVTGYGWTFGRIWIKGGNFGVHFNQASDIFIGTPMELIGCATAVQCTSIENGHIEWVADTCSYLAGAIDGSHASRFICRAFSVNSTVQVAGIQLGGYDTTNLNRGLDIDYIGQRTGGVGATVAYTEDSSIRLQLSNSALYTASGGNITSGLTYGSGNAGNLDVKLERDGSISSVFTGTQFGTLADISDGTSTLYGNQVLKGYSSVEQSTSSSQIAYEITQNGGNAAAMYAHSGSNLHASNIARFEHKNSTDTGVTVDIRNRGTGDILNMGNNATASLSKVNNAGVFFPVQAPTASAPAYVKGGMYFDTTLNKLRIGGATAWETVSSV